MEKITTEGIGGIIKSKLHIYSNIHNLPVSSATRHTHKIHTEIGRNTHDK